MIYYLSKVGYVIGEMYMIEKILPNLYMIRVPIPRNPLKTTNSYVIKDQSRNLIIDTGLHLEECKEVMFSSLKKLDVDLKETDFFITHIHSDHLDLALTLATDSSRIYFNQPDAEDISRYDTWNDELYNIARICGFPENRLREVVEKYSWHIYEGVDLARFTILKEGDTINVGGYILECLETNGHSRGHMCLYEPKRRILIAGDHILNDITPNISLFSYEENPLNDYMNSLDKIYDFDIKLVLPGHRDFIRDCKKRIKELKHHHQMRVEEILLILESGKKDAFQIASKISWDMSYDSWELFQIHHKMFATLEAIAHLKYLEEKGSIQKEMKGQKILFSLK